MNHLVKFILAHYFCDTHSLIGGSGEVVRARREVITDRTHSSQTAETALLESLLEHVSVLFEIQSTLSLAQTWLW